MIKEHYVDRVIHILGRVDQTRKYHREVVEAAMNGAYTSVFCSLYDQDPREVDSYSTLYEAQSVSGGVLQIPTAIIPLSRVGSGVLSVRPSDDTDTVYIPVTMREAKLLSHMEEARFTSDVPYTVRSGGIYFEGGGTFSVDIDVIRAFESYGDDEHIQMPRGYDQEVVRLALSELGVVQSVNLLNNNTDEPSDSQERGA